MPDFASLYAKPMSGGTKAKTAPSGIYPVKITKYDHKFNEYFDPKVFQVSILCRITGLPEGADAADPDYATAMGSVVSKDFDTKNEDGSDAKNLYQINAFLESLGLYDESKSMLEVLPQIVGKDGIAIVERYTDKKGDERNRIKKLTGIA